MNEFLIGYARVSTNEHDLTAQQNALEALGVRSNLIYTDHGLTGANRAPPGLREALAACRNGDTLVVAKLDRLARSLRDAKDTIDELTVKGVKLSIGGSVHDPTDPVGRLLFNVLAMVAQFESDPIRARTREGMQVAKAKGRLRGKQPKLSMAQQRHLMEVHRAGTHSTAELAELFNVARSTAPFNDNPSTVGIHSPAPVVGPINSATEEPNPETGRGRSNGRAASQGDLLQDT